jgi:hypothetical protein
LSAVKHQTQPFVRQHEAATAVNWKKLALYFGVFVAVFLLGLIPMWLRAREFQNQRDVAQRQLRLSQMENSLSKSTINARRGQYEPARQMASDFFTSLRMQIDKGSDSDLTPVQREKLGSLLKERDDTITLLARSDPAAADRLSDLYVAFSGVISAVQPQSPG